MWYRVQLLNPVYSFRKETAFAPDSGAIYVGHSCHGVTTHRPPEIRSNPPSLSHLPLEHRYPLTDLSIRHQRERERESHERSSNEFSIATNALERAKWLFDTRPFPGETSSSSRPISTCSRASRGGVGRKLLATPPTSCCSPRDRFGREFPGRVSREGISRGSLS